MSESVFLRSRARELTIWTPFLYEFFSESPEEDRTIIFGLYAGTYKHGLKYLEEIEAEDLQRLVDTYDNNIAQLTMEGQALVLKIAAERYIFNVDIMIDQEKLETQRHKLAAGEQEVDARIAALEVDREALDTLRTRIEIAIELANNKIRELEAQISLEIVNGKYVELEIAEKQLAVTRAELKVLTTAMRGLEIQIAITETGISIAEAEVSKYRYKADVAGINARIAGTELTANQLTVEQTELETMEYEIDNLAAKKIELIEARSALTEAEKAGLVIEQSKQLGFHTVKLEEKLSRLVAQKQVNDNKELTAETRKDIELSKDNLEKLLALRDKLSVLRETTKKTEVDSAHSAAAYSSYIYAIQVAEMLATADITNVLTHQISGV